MTDNIASGSHTDVPRDRQDGIAKVDGVVAQGEVGSLGLAAERYDAAGRQMQQQLRGPLDRGRKNEKRVASTLVAHLRTLTGSDVSWKEGNDTRGEDFLLLFEDGRQQIVQVTMALQDPKVCASLNQHGQVDVLRSFDALARDFTRAIKRKSTIGFDQAQKTWLALDAYLTPTATRQEIVSVYAGEFGNPCNEFGFSAVWLVGPTPERCISLCECASYTKRG